MPSTKRILVSVTNDLVTDQRVHKVCSSLVGAGYEICLIGRKRKNSGNLEKRGYETHRMKLLFHKGPLFYLNFNIALFFHLLFNKADIFLSNDLDTLPANFFASRIKSKPLVYDSHEYFTEVPELVNRKWVRKIWEFLESRMLPKVHAAYTVSEPIAQAYKSKYGVKMELIRNFPVLNDADVQTRDLSEKIIIYQGAVNVHRGIEQMLEAMQWIEGAKFWIVGGGDLESQIQDQIKKLKLESKVVFHGRKAFHELKQFTKQASIGVSLEQAIGLNYTFALPNKLFDYIHAGLPVLASDLPEIRKVFEKYDIGMMVKDEQVETIAEAAKIMLGSGKMQIWKEECRKASLEYNWQNEEKKLLQIFRGL